MQNASTSSTILFVPVSSRDGKTTRGYGLRSLWSGARFGRRVLATNRRPKRPPLHKTTNYLDALTARAPAAEPVERRPLRAPGSRDESAAEAAAAPQDDELP